MLARLFAATAIIATLASCAGPPPLIQTSPTPAAPTAVPEFPHPSPTPSLGGTRSPASAAVGDVVTLKADGRDVGGWFEGVRWTLDDSAMARFTGPDVGAAVDIQVLAPGPIRIRASRGGSEVKTLLAGISSPPPGKAVDLSGYGVDESGKVSSGSAPTSGSRVVTTLAGWRAFAAASGLPKEMRDAPPPVDLEKASLVVLFEGLANVTDPPPVLTRVDPAPPGFAEIVWPRVNRLAVQLPMFALYVKVFEVAKLPEGARMQVVRE